MYTSSRLTQRQSWEQPETSIKAEPEYYCGIGKVACKEGLARNQSSDGKPSLAGLFLSPF